MKVFISHSSKDKEKAASIVRWLEERGVQCFLAPRDIPPGMEYAEQIMNGIDTSDAMLLLMSENANQSPHVLREVERATSKALPMLVYRLERVKLSKSMEYFLMTHQWVTEETDDNYDVIMDYLDKVKQGHVSSNHVANKQERNADEASKGRKKYFPIGFVILLVILLVVAIGCRKFITESSNAAKEEYYAQNQSYTAQVGDTVVFGTYNEEPIEWRVLKVDEESKSVQLIAKYILTMKAWDAPESGIYNSDGQQDYWMKDTVADTDLELQAHVRGSNDWSTSNIRSWLNADREVVEFIGQAPTSAAMSEKKNAYNNEAGFLYGFTEEERSYLKADASGDRVSLLTKADIALFEAGSLSIYAEPTKACLEQDMTEWFEFYQNQTDMKTYSFWLKDAVEGTSSQCYLVSGGYTEEIFETANVGLEGYGIRPVVTVELESGIFADNIQ